MRVAAVIGRNRTATLRMLAMLKRPPMVHLGCNAGTSLKMNSVDLISKASTILGFNIFLVLVERSAKDIHEVIALAATKKYRAVVGKTLPMSQVADATRYLDERRSERSYL
jgi:NADPH:quinone reductase-like Zn-dependent oxidoreductase